MHHAKTPGYYSDGGGLVLQVSANGTKSWIFRYRFDGRRHEMGLGSCALVSLAKARELAQSCRQLIVQGSDPLAERRQVRAARHAERARHMTFDQCAAAYIQAHKSGWRNAKHADQWTRTLATYAAPVIGALPVGEVETDHVVKVLAPIWATKTETATRLRGRIESILDWATVSKFRQGENPARWRGHLDYLLANPNKVTRVKNFPALPWPQVAALMAELRQREGVSARALEFAILTAARSGEVRGARWDEVDLTRRLDMLLNLNSRWTREFKAEYAKHQDVLIRKEQRRLQSAQARHTQVEILSYIQQWQADLIASEPHHEVHQALAAALQEPSRIAAWHSELASKN